MIEIAIVNGLVFKHNATRRVVRYENLSLF